MDVVRDVHTLGCWRFPDLEMIVEAPLLRPDGTILQVPGYDAQSKVIYAPAPGLRIRTVPSNPTRSDVEAARHLLLNELLVDFPFVDAASLANTLALFISSAVRSMIDGPVPLAVIDKPAPGTGASLLAELAAIIITGRPAAMMSEVDSEEEWRQQITSVLLEGPTIIVLDNVEHVLASKHLARALTSTTWKDRILGRSIQAELPQRAIWIATGNNLWVGRDQARRSYRMRLDAKMERPYQRSQSQFRHPLPQWAVKKRGDLLAAILTIARAWLSAGRPAAPTPTLGGFEAWAEVLGGILAFIGVEGFLANATDLHEQIDDDTVAWAAFCTGLFETFGNKSVTVSEIEREVRREGSQLREALPPELLGALDGGQFTKSLGYALRHNADRIFDETRVERAGKNAHTKVARWRVMRVTAGNVSTPPYTRAARLSGKGQGRNHPPSPASPAKRRGGSTSSFGEVPDELGVEPGVMGDLPEYDLPRND